jgi:hypothetical protein
VESGGLFRPREPHEKKDGRELSPPAEAYAKLTM